MIRKMEMKDIDACADILCSVYNNELWQCRWTVDTAKAYLTDYFKTEKFVGFIIENNNNICGAIFCHEKIWWNNSEIFIDEMFIKPQIQNKGYGTQLIKAVEGYVKEHNLAGITLSTNRYTPAPKFYKKNGFCCAEHVMFMYKEI